VDYSTDRSPSTPLITRHHFEIPRFATALVVWKPMSDSTSKVKRDIAPGEPAFIRRLPEGVEYTLIKTIFIDLPSRLPTLLWAAHPDTSPLLRAFNDRTVRATVRALRRAENSETNRELIAGVRYELVQLCLQELHSPWSPHPDVSISEILVSPQLFREGHRPPGPPVQHLRITVTKTITPRRSDPFAPAAVVVEQRFLASRPSTLGRRHSVHRSRTT
jgi:hypothetical protein